jgi:DNA-binding winged helix-turn-helix (wHTH) protein/Flp pilus assembly protein TadD
MDGPSARSAPLAFDRYVLRFDERRLLLDGTPVVLRGKAFELLAILVAHRGAAVSRDALYEQLWPNGTVEDGNLTQNVYLLRRTLDPAGGGRPLIETVPRYGYRFARPVRDIARQPPHAARSWRRAFVYASVAAAAMLVASASGLRSSNARLSPTASVTYALARYHLNLRTRADLGQSMVYFARTVREAPQSAAGYAGLASAYGLNAEYERSGTPAFDGALARARRYRDAALARDSESPEAHAVAAFLAYRFAGDDELAEREFRRSFALDPRNAAAHHWHAILLFSGGAIDAAVAELELAHQLEPTSEVISRWLGRAYYYQRRPDAAIAALSETLAIQPADAPALLTLASAQEQRGRLEDALRTLEIVRRRLPHESVYVIADEARVRHLLHPGAADPRMVARIDRLVAGGRVDAVESALFYIALGLRDRAAAVLRNARPLSPIAATQRRFDPRFDAVRRDPRFHNLVQ